MFFAVHHFCFVLVVYIYIYIYIYIYMSILIYKEVIKNIKAHKETGLDKIAVKTVDRNRRRISSCIGSYPPDFNQQQQYLILSVTPAIN